MYVLYRGVIFFYTTNRHEINVLLPSPFDKILAAVFHGVAVDDAVLLQNRKFHQIGSILVLKMFRSF